MRSRLPHSAGVRSGAAGEAVFFDEFKGNAGGERFQCIITDPLNRRIFGILPSRTAETVQDYLHSFPNRDEVKCVIMDMNRGFRDVAKAFLPNAKTVINRFHVARYCTEAMENIRRSFQKALPKAQRKYSNAQGDCCSPIATGFPRKSAPPWM